MFGFGEKEPPKRLKFKQGDMVKLIIGDIRAMVTLVRTQGYWDYSIEYWNYDTLRPMRLGVKEFELGELG